MVYDACNPRFVWVRLDPISRGNNAMQKAIIKYTKYNVWYV